MNSMINLMKPALIAADVYAFISLWVASNWLRLLAADTTRTFSFSPVSKGFYCYAAIRLRC